MPPPHSNGPWAWAPFVRRHYLLYARLLRTVCDEVRLGRFELTNKRDLLMLHAVAALFDTPGVLREMRIMGAAPAAAAD